MLSSKIRRKSSVVAYSPALVIRFCSRMVGSVFHLLVVSGPRKSTNNIARRVSGHFFQTASGSHRHLRASCLSTCRVRTPAQENLAPSFIRSTIASSPSRLITVRLLRSITSLRPSKSRLAFLQVVRSSATHGPLSFPSTTSLRCAGESTMEILNILNRTTQ